jgi:cellulose synthase/poly-beta-1,6-N-acetylglucosamine synthase-like glycosyltransferase
MKFKILIFIITYKASFRVLDLIKKIPFKYLRKHSYTIYASDDASKDNTILYLKQLKRKYKKKLVINENYINLGYGGNIKKCIRYAYKNKYDYAVMLHGDNQYNPRYIEKMVKLLIKNSSNVVISGSRMFNKSDALKGNMPIYKFLGNIFLTKLFNLFYNTNFTDCHTGYWAYNLKKINKSLFKKSDDNFCFDIDMRLLLAKDRLSIKEIPIKTFYGSERSSTHFIYALRFFLKIIKFKILKKL